MPKFSKKIEVPSIPQIACFGAIELGRQPRISKSGSGYVMFQIRAMPSPHTEGVAAQTNFMYHPDWLAADFDPEAIQVDPVTLAKAKSRAERLKEENPEADLPDNIVEAIRNNSQSFVFQRNIYNAPPGRPALLQSLIGSEVYDEFCDAVDGMEPQELLKLLKETMQKENEEVGFIYECQQSVMNEEKTNRLEVSALYRIELPEDIERWSNIAKTRDIDLTFDPDQIAG
jgi:hypothetical protein